MVKKIEEKHHARLSPSAAKRWMTCPGSARLIAALNSPDNPSKYAAEGTVAHEVGELCLRGNKDPKDYIGQKFTSDGFTFTVTNEMTDAVDEYVDYIRDIVSGGSDWSIGDVTDGGPDWELEVEVNCNLKILGVPGMEGGTSDATLINRRLKKIMVCDYKHGAGIAVDVISNVQAMNYGLGAMLKLGIDIGDDWEIILVIIQPRAFHPDGGIRSWGISSDNLIKWAYDILIPAGFRCHEPDAPLVPSGEGCRFCPASGNCEAQYQKSQEMIMLDFTDCGRDKPPNPDTLTAEQKAGIMEHSVMLRNFIVAVENQIKIDMDNGSEEYSGRFKLVRKTTQRILTENAFDPIASPLLDYIKEEDMYISKPKGLGELEKAIKKELKLQGVTGFVKLSQEIMSEVTFKPEGVLVVAPESDKRRAVQNSLVGDFANLDSKN